MQSAEQRLREEGIRGEVFLFKNNTDSAGNSYGCHENYLVEREGDFSKFTDVLIPFLVTRQVYAGAGKVLQTARGAMYCIAQRAEHIWEGVSSATTRSRPIINTRDEPHADAERFRRLHVIVGDSNMSEYTTFLKVGATSIILRMLEEDGAPWRDLTLENPIRAIREISHDITCRRRVRLANGRELSAVEIQSEYLNRALRFAKRHGLPPLEQKALEMWEHVMTHLENDPLKLTHRGRLGDQVPPDRGVPRARRPAAHAPARLARSTSRTTTSPGRDRSTTCSSGAARSSASSTDDEINEAIEHAAADDAGPAARRVHQAGQGTQARLHGRLGAPEAQRPGPAHGALQGPVQVARRAGRAADRVVCSVVPPTMPSFRTGKVVTAPRGARRAAARRGRPRRRARARLRADAAHRAGRASAIASSSTPPRSSSVSAPAGGTSCTGTWRATTWSERRARATS